MIIDAQINFFMIEILETLPRITVYGLFHVDLSLLPKVIIDQSLSVTC